MKPQDPDAQEAPLPGLQGSLEGRGLRIAVVASRFHQGVTARLVEGATRALGERGVREEDSQVVWVPGCFELPLAARALACSGQWDALVCVGTVIRGETAHFDYVADQAATGIATVARETGVPVLFGVLTTDTVEQARDRAGGKVGNKGYEAALNAIEMANLLRQLPAPGA